MAITTTTTTTKIGKTITGNKLANSLIGTEYNDTIFGDAGSDTIDGRGGADAIRGGLGNDTLTGGTGNDTFLFETTGSANGLDTITDLGVKRNGVVLQNDILDLSLPLTKLINVTGSNAASYVKVVDGQLLVDRDGTKATLGWETYANLTGVQYGDYVHIRTSSFDGWIQATGAPTPTGALENDTTDGLSGHATDLVTSDPDIIYGSAPSGYHLETRIAEGSGAYGAWNSGGYTPPSVDGVYHVEARYVSNGTGLAGGSKTIDFTLDTTADYGVSGGSGADGYLGVHFGTVSGGNAELTLAGLDGDIDQSKITVTVDDGTSGGTPVTAVWDEIGGHWDVDISGFSGGTTLTAHVNVTDYAGNTASGATDTYEISGGSAATYHMYVDSTGAWIDVDKNGSFSAGVDTQLVYNSEGLWTLASGLTGGDKHSGGNFDPGDWVGSGYGYSVSGTTFALEQINDASGAPLVDFGAGEWTITFTDARGPTVDISGFGSDDKIEVDLRANSSNTNSNGAGSKFMGIPQQLIISGSPTVTFKAGPSHVWTGTTPSSSGKAGFLWGDYLFPAGATGNIYGNAFVASFSAGNQYLNWAANILLITKSGFPVLAPPHQAFADAYANTFSGPFATWSNGTTIGMNQVTFILPTFGA